MVIFDTFLGVRTWYNHKMKIIFLNAWNGKQEVEMREFLQQHAADTDIFCFQEAEDSFRIIAREYLTDFTEEYRYLDGFDTPRGREDWSQATYIRKTLSVIQSSTAFNTGDPAGLGIVTELELHGAKVYILNYHGVSYPKDKLDSEARLKQSHNIIEYFSNKPGLHILGGDFNFLPTTESYRMLAEYPYKELIAEYKIPSTRNHLYFDNRTDTHLFSDYIFVSPQIKVRELTTPDILVSDHLPLILEVEI